MTRPNAEERKRKLREKAIEDTIEKIERAIASLDCLNKHYEGHYEIEAEQLKAMIRMLEWDLKRVKDSKSEREIKRLEKKYERKEKVEGAKGNQESCVEGAKRNQESR